MYTPLQPQITQGRIITLSPSGRVTSGDLYEAFTQKKATSRKCVQMIISGDAIVMTCLKKSAGLGEGYI